MTFRELATMVEEVYGVYYDREEEFFICPLCGEPLYMEDYITGEFEEECPVCGYEWEFDSDCEF